MTCGAVAAVAGATVTVAGADGTTTEPAVTETVAVSWTWPVTSIVCAGAGASCMVMASPRTSKT